MRSHLVQFVGVKEQLNLFSPETKQQFLIGQEIAKLAKQGPGTAIDKLRDLMWKCLNADQGWRQYHAKKMVGLKQAPQDTTKLDIATAERTAWLKYRSGNAIEAGEIVQKDLDPRHMASNSDKGWFVQLAASYFHAADPGRAQEMQKKAFQWNTFLFRPVARVGHSKIIATGGPAGSEHARLGPDAHRPERHHRVDRGFGEQPRVRNQPLPL